jgi:calcineurin-like phosphoesterase family protein
MLLLHLSDIHFRWDEVDSAMDPNAHLRNELLLDAENMCKKIGESPEAILISGDIAYSAKKEEYEFALAWLEKLSRRCGSSLSAVFVVPGNHDVVRSIADRRVIQSIHKDIKNVSDITLDATLSGILKDDEAGRLLYESLGPYNTFANRFFCDLLPPERTRAQRDLTLNDGSILRLSGLNSAFVSSSADRAGDLFVDPASFQLIREQGVEYLVMCHHPFSWLRQGATLHDFLNTNARIHLFGHEHTNRIEPGRDWVRIAASAAHPDRTESGWEPGYNLLRLCVKGTGAERVLVADAHVRVWQSRPGEFRPKTDRGNDVFTQEIRLAPWRQSDQTAAKTATTGGAGVQIDAASVSAAPHMDKGDPMDALRDVSLRFFKLTLSQKSAIAGRLELIEEDDANLPDFERFRRVLIRARERGLIERLEHEISEISGPARED